MVQLVGVDAVIEVLDRSFKKLHWICVKVSDRAKKNKSYNHDTLAKRKITHTSKRLSSDSQRRSKPPDPRKIHKTVTVQNVPSRGAQQENPQI